MQKFRLDDIKPFSFSDLQGLEKSSEKIEAFEFQSLDKGVLKTREIPQETLRLERKSEKNNNFKIDSTVREHRGISKQEQDDVENKIKEEVTKRLDSSMKQAVDEGRSLGREEGKKEIQNVITEEMKKRIDDFAMTIEAVQSQANSVLEKNKSDIQEFVKRMAQWVALKEINNKVYFETLLEKLILEMNARRNLVIKVGKNNFNQMPEVISSVEARLGQLTNVRIEIVPELNYPGIILESENGLIDGSLEGIFQNIDKIFEQVTSNE